MWQGRLKSLHRVLSFESNVISNKCNKSDGFQGLSRSVTALVFCLRGEIRVIKKEEPFQSVRFTCFLLLRGKGIGDCLETFRCFTAAVNLF